MFAGALLSDHLQQAATTMPIFAMVRFLHCRLERDPILDCAIFDLKSEEVSPVQAVSLHEFTTTPCYFVPATVPDKDDKIFNNTPASSSVDDSYWHCDWLVPKI